LYQAGKKRLETIDYGTMFLYAVTCVATIMAVRSMLFNILLWGQVVAALYGKTTPRELKISFGFKEKLASAGVTLIIVSVVFTNIVNYTSEYHSEENWGELDQLVSLLQEETSGADTSKLTVFPSDISQGQYLYHFVGLRPYIDGRLETYVSDCNGQEDIFAEYLGAIKQGNLYNVVDKYKFDYVVLDGPYSYSLPSGYSLVGSTYDDGDESFYYLYRYDG
jgi:hypothetical protein